MKIKYASKKIEELCTVYTHALKKLNQRRATALFLRLKQLKRANSVDDLIRFHTGRCHRLTGDLNGKFAMDLDHPYRLIFTVELESNSTEFAIIIKILDYHNH